MTALGRVSSRPLLLLSVVVLVAAKPKQLIGRRGEGVRRLLFVAMAIKVRLVGIVGVSLQKQQQPLVLAAHRQTIGKCLLACI